MNARFIGLDLAWSPRNNSAGVVLEARNETAQWIDHCERLGSNAQVVAFIREAAGRSEPVFVAVDAPLIVPNAEGSRPVDRQITRLFGRYGAGCYPAYRNRPGSCTRGEEIVASLAQDGFVQDPYIPQRATMRSVFEVYPHPATIALFHLEHTIRYKARPNRGLDLQRSELKRLRDHLLSLEHSRPAIRIPADIVQRDVHALRGTSFKRYEDLLDATLCAYIAYYAWYWGPDGYQVYGDTTEGYILVPMTGWMRDRLAAH